jgi:hypothetical protein
MTEGRITSAMQERTMARCRPTLRAEDVEALTLLMSPAADEFAIALDRCGWMIVQQPQFGDRRWFMNCPSDACPEWAENDVPKEPPAPQPRLRVIDGGKNETAGPEPQS